MTMPAHSSHSIHIRVPYPTPDAAGPGGHWYLTYSMLDGAIAIYQAGNQLIGGGRYEPGGEVLPMHGGDPAMLPILAAAAPKLRLWDEVIRGYRSGVLP